MMLSPIAVPRTFVLDSPAANLVAWRYSLMANLKGKWLTDKYWVTEFNYLDDVRRFFTLPEKVQIHDVTLREAEQSPHVVLKPDEKLKIYEALDDMGVYSVELLPIISSDDREVAKELVRMRKAGRKAKVVFLCRWDEREVDFAAESGADGVVVECPGSPWFGHVVWGLDEKQMIEKLVKAAAHAKKAGLYTSVMPWEATKAPIEFLERLYKSVANDGGVDQITYTDTMGFGLPWTTAYMVRKIREWAPNVTVGMHAHNDFGLATSVMLSGVVGGASTVHTAVNALGERAGNAPTEEVVVGIELLLGLDTGVDLSRIYGITRLVSEIAKIPIPNNKAVTGDNEFTFESGMVVDMTLRMTKSEKPYSTMPFAPELIGRKGFRTILGKMSGGTVIRDRLEKMGLSATKEQVSEIVERVKSEAIVRKWSISEEIFESIAREVLERK
jgi:2-isopropylmalate synthase